MADEHRGKLYNWQKSGSKSVAGDTHCRMEHTRVECDDSRCNSSQCAGWGGSSADLPAGYGNQNSDFPLHRWVALLALHGGFDGTTDNAGVSLHAPVYDKLYIEA